MHLYVMDVRARGTIDGMFSTAASPALVGRVAEIERLTAMLNGVASEGATLVIRGEPGIGKSRLLTAGIDDAHRRGMTVLTATGVQSEARIGFAGLHQLLRPLRARVPQLPPRLQRALDGAFALSDGPAPSLFQVALATLELLADAAADAPVLVVAEDAHWLDEATCDVLAFVARRVDSDPIVILAAAREGYPSALIDSGLPELRVSALDDAAAARLLDTVAPDLPPTRRRAVLARSHGNPLALRELALERSRLSAASPIDSSDLTATLERAFAIRAEELPERARLLLAVTALDDGDRLDEILDAGSAVSSVDLVAADLQPAVDAGIVELTLRSVRFRHPLVRSAIRDTTDVGTRRRIHSALADRLSADLDRSVWHRAALVHAPAEDIASLLEQAGHRALARGAVADAAAAFERAAALSDPASTDHRRLVAAQLQYELGHQGVVGRLLADIDGELLPPVDHARLVWVAEMVTPGTLKSIDHLERLLDAASNAGQAGDVDLQIALLWLITQRMQWARTAPALHARVIAAVEALGGASSEDLRVVAIHSFADPFGHASELVERLQTELRDRRPHDWLGAAPLLGPAAYTAGAFGVALPMLDAAADALRLDGRLSYLPQILRLQAVIGACRADWDRAIPAADEAQRLAHEVGDPLWEAGAAAATALVAGMRGDTATADAAGGRAEAVATAAHASFIVALAQSGIVLAALGDSRYLDAWDRAQRVFDPADPAHHPLHTAWIVVELAHAAIHVDRVDNARARLEEVTALVGPRPADWISLRLSHAAALLAPDHEAEDAFATALAAARGGWPFQHAQLQLAYGQWLRRRRAIVESRAPLREARDAFDRLGCNTWAAQARRELRASGVSSRRRSPDARDQLTAQELQIASFAADGLTNREIGEKLFLSHRTISTHLYRVFPKLGITSRSELGKALRRSI